MSAMAFYRRLRAAGVDEETALLCAEAFEQEVKVAVEAILEPRRAKDRARKARNSVESAESAESAEAPLSPALSPQTPLTHPHTPGGVTTRTRGADDFEAFWSAYPRKDAKATARKKFGSAVARVPVATLIAAVERQRTWEQWRRGFIPHAATWLHQERWTDEEPPVADEHPRKAHDRPDHHQRPTAREDRLGRSLAGLMAAVDEREPAVGASRVGVGR